MTKELISYLLLSASVILFIAGCSRSETDTKTETEINTMVENNFYELRIYDAAPGKLEDLHTRFRNHALRLFAKHKIESLGYWTPVDDTVNQLYFLLAYPDRESRESSWEAFTSDQEWIRAKEASETDGRLVTNVQSTFLTETDYTPEVESTVSESPRVFEFRKYKATPGNLDHLHARFRDHTVGLFSKHGMKHFGYWTPVDSDKGADDTLIYIISHKDADSRDASFAAFRSDPAWASARAASEVNAGGSLTVNVESVLLKATDYSPTR